MPDTHTTGNEFIQKISKIIEDNISNEQFGVSELAHEVNMSRSNLLRKVKKLTNLSVSRFIRQVRLQYAMEMLHNSSMTVSEVSFNVGFSSTSYFIKCFRDHYGYPPGEAGKRPAKEPESDANYQSPKKGNIVSLISIIFLLLLITILFVFVKPFSRKNEKLDKSIAVLPFKNDSNDSSNVYLINGLIESILNSLQKIEDLRVVSRTSVEKYRNVPKSIPEIGRELDVNYFIEGSGQKVGNKILLHIQLIEVPGDRQLWSEQYSRELKDIFELQQEVAKRIAHKIEVIITPKEEEQIDKIPTDDLLAYDHFLKGLELFYQGNRESIHEAIGWFEKAIEQYADFARAYADIAIAYYFLDFNQEEQHYSDQINYYADKALLLDPELIQALIAKALFYLYTGEKEQALPYLEKALEYNPNSAIVINILSDFYTNYIPNTAKYLEYALKGISLDIAAHDSVTASFIYLHLSNAFIQSGFVDEALKYIDRSLEFDPGNIYSQYVKAFILYAKNGELEQTRELLIKTLQKDTTRLDVMQEVAKIFYYQRDYENSYRYYKKFMDIREMLNLDIYKGEDAKIAVVLSEMGMDEESDKILRDFKDFADRDQSIYKALSLAAYYSYIGDTTSSLNHLRLFLQEDNFHYWIILFAEIDPLFDNIKDLQEFTEIMNKLKQKLMLYHDQIKLTLEEKELL